MKRTIYVFSGIALFILLTAALPYFNIIEVYPIIGWMIGFMVLFVLPLVLLTLLVLGIRQITRKPPPDEEVLDLNDFHDSRKKEAVSQELADNDQLV
jgi:hypothetical protein